jgi:hypothetical protein
MTNTERWLLLSCTFGLRIEWASLVGAARDKEVLAPVKQSKIIIKLSLIIKLGGKQGQNLKSETTNLGPREYVTFYYSGKETLKWASNNTICMRRHSTPGIRQCPWNFHYLDFQSASISQQFSSMAHRGFQIFPAYGIPTMMSHRKGITSSSDIP